MRAKKVEFGFFALLVAVGGFASTALAAPAGSVVAETPRRAHAALQREDAPERPPLTTDIRLASLSPASTAQAANATVATLQTAPAAAGQGDPAPRHSTKELLLLTLVGGMLVAYQLLRKHRLLRQQPFSL